MKYNNRLYPHPVLGIKDDVGGDFSCQLTVESNREYIILKPIFSIKNEDIERLIQNEEAEICMQIYCRGTLFRHNHRITDRLSGDVKIEADKLNGETEVDFFVCTKKGYLQYSNSKFNESFNGLNFGLEKGDIIAYGGKGKFFANKSPEQLKAVSSIMKIKKGKNKEGVFKIEFDDPKFISLILSSSDFDYYNNLKEYRTYVNIIHASLVVPALVETVHLMENENSGFDEFQENEWYKVLAKILDETKGDSPLEKVQNLLDLPLNREFLSMIEALNDEE